MPTGKDWKDHFSNYNSEDLKVFLDHLEELFKDDMFDEIFGNSEGLKTLALIIKSIIYQRTGRYPE